MNILIATLMIAAANAGDGFALVPQPKKLAPGEGVCANAEIRCVREASLPPEGYRLSVSPDGVTIFSADDAGEFYARVTLSQLENGKGAYRCAEIEDAPSFGWRGVHFDDCRHFFGKDEIKKTLDAMALNKLNRFHWHLTDDQGWRLEVPGYPELTKYGAVRSSSPKHGEHVTFRDSKERQAAASDGEKYGPFYYTEADVKEILAYAAARHITVVPEIELPGHFQAVLAAYPDLACHPDKSNRDPLTVWGISRNVMCIGNDEAVRFMEDVLDYVARLFPSEVVHIGGDECPSDAWKTCAKCQALIKREGLKDEHDLQPWITRHFVEFLAARGKRTIGWDEYLLGDVPRTALGMSWRVGGGGAGHKCLPPGEWAARGHDMVLTPNRFCYLDYNQGLENDPYEYIGGNLSLEKVYSLDPYAGVAEKDRAHILGGQGNNWSEYTWGPNDLEWKMWPRMSALAEIFWTGPNHPSFGDFKSRMYVHRRRLRAIGVNCAPIDADAQKLLGAAPPKCTDEAYLAYTKTGDRTAWGKPYAKRNTDFERILELERGEGEGRFLPKIAEYLDAFSASRTWTINAHDPRLVSFNGEHPVVELGSARIGRDVAEALGLFAEKLPPETVRKVRTELERRVFAPYLETAGEVKDGRKISLKEHWWFHTSNNWNAVVHSLVARAALKYYPFGSPERRLIVDSAVAAMPYFLAGFTDDGYCSEGAGYWNYGFGHFLELGLALREAPEKIDLFADPRTRVIAEYGFTYKLTARISPLFADGGGTPDEKFLSLCRGIWPGIDTGSLTRTTMFPVAQVYISRGVAGGLSVGLKGGHNDEFHNHDDVGSYNIAIGDTIVTGDVGGEVYTRRTFSKDRYESKVLNSYGHPVPRVNGHLQGTGRQYRASVIEATAGEKCDRFTLDLTRAYDCPELVSLVRSFDIDRSGKIVITDKVKFLKPSSFEDPILTLGEYEGVEAAESGDGVSGRIRESKATLAFSIKASGACDRFEETIENPSRRSPRLLGVKMNAVTEATVVSTFTPM